MALNVTCGNATIPSLSGDKRTHRDHRQSVARDPKATTASFDMCLRSSRVSDIRGCPAQVYVRIWRKTKSCMVIDCP